METYYSQEEIIEAGLDEAGRGSLAGPVFAGAVIWPRELDPEIEHPKLNDSKKLSKKRREYLRNYIEENAIDFAVGSCTPQEIDEINILKASHLAMHRAISKLNIEPELLLVDGNMFTNYFKTDGDIIEHECIIKGDGKYASISAASILAKTYHDDYIDNLLDKNPELEKYGWDTNMCYGTKKHMDAIKKYGTTIHHRKSFKLK
jgi:ribonuclease HII